MLHQHVVIWHKYINDRDIVTPKFDSLLTALTWHFQK